jgi:hypothetical protein
MPSALPCDEALTRGCLASNRRCNMPGKKHVAGANKKENRKYEHIKESYQKRGTSTKRAKEIAARTVNKQK